MSNLSYIAENKRFYSVSFLLFFSVIWNQTVFADFNPRNTDVTEISEESKKEIEKAVKDNTNDLNNTKKTADDGDGSKPDDAVANSENTLETKKNTEEELKFDIWEYRVEGIELIDRNLIERVVYPHLGPKKTIDDVENARKALADAYRDEGYGAVFVNIPEQDVENGVVVLDVTEGKLERVVISGSRYYSLGKIREKVSSLVEGQAVLLPEFQEQLVELNKGFIGREITPVLRAGQTPGKVEVELKVKDEFPLHADLELNNRYSVNTNDLRLNANVRYDNLWQLGHSASLGYVVAPENRDDVEVFFGTYLFRVPETNLAFALFGVNSSSDVVTTGEINQIGRGKQVGIRGIYSLPSVGRFTHSVLLGSDFKDFDQVTSFVDGNELILDSPISYFTFVAGYTGNWFHEVGRTNLNLESVFAPRILGNTNREFNLRRFGARPNFKVFKATVRHERPTYYDTLLKLRFQAQLADSPLINNEQFSVGGLDTVRGYLESQQLADDGLLASIELQSPSLTKYFSEYNLGEFVNEFHLKAFTEGAVLKLQEALPGQEDRFRLASLGAGFDLEAFDNLTAEFLWALALADNSDIDSGDSRIHFSLGYGF